MFPHLLTLVVALYLFIIGYYHAPVFDYFEGALYQQKAGLESAAAFASYTALRVLYLASGPGALLLMIYCGFRVRDPLILLANGIITGAGLWIYIELLQASRLYL